MKATEIRVGDLLMGASENGERLPIYTVEEVRITKGEVLARVRFRIDGGDDIRSWDPDMTIPLIHPEEVDSIDIYSDRGNKGS